MIENRTLGSKIFDVINVIIMIICALLCIVPVWYVICVSLSSKEAVNAGLVSFWPVGFNLFSYQKILGESDFFRSFWVSIQRVLLGTGVSMFCILLAAYPLSKTSKQKYQRVWKKNGERDPFLCGSWYSACCLTEEPFRGILQ